VPSQSTGLTGRVTACPSSLTAAFSGN
jgi:hypothetical protein